MITIYSKQIFPFFSFKLAIHIPLKITLEKPYCEQLVLALILHSFIHSVQLLTLGWFIYLSADVNDVWISWLY